jgi:hypothetical protein
VADGRWDYANWLLPRLMDYKGYVSYAVFAAELVLPVWEKQYPNDDRPRKAIEAAKKCIDNPSEENRAWAARAARDASWAEWEEYLNLAGTGWHETAADWDPEKPDVKMASAMLNIVPQEMRKTKL